MLPIPQWFFRLRHLDVEVTAGSQWRRLYYLSYLLSVVLVVLGMGTPWWMVVAVGVVSAIVYLLVLSSPQQLLHITSADMTDSSSQWQLLFEGTNGDELWEMSLAQARSFYSCIQLKFDVTHPTAQRMTLIVWRDQVEADSWRQLKVLSRWG